MTRSEVGFQMQPGETLIAITDGVTDTVGGRGERFGIERVYDVLAPLHGQGSEAICQRLLSALEAFQVGSQTDDTAIVVMRFLGERAAAAEGEDLKGVVGARAAG